MTAKDYPVTFPYGATTKPYTPDNPHRGDDRSTPYGTNLVIGSTIVARTGNTGYVLPVPTPINPYAGSHLHTQEWQGAVSNHRKPKNAFKAGKVVEVGENKGFGKYVTIQNDDGWNTSYCHLSSINVKIGDIVGKELDMPIGYDTANQIHQDLTGADWGLPSWEVNAKGMNFAETYSLVQNSQTRKDYQAYIQSLIDKPTGNVPTGTYLKVDPANVFKVIK